jgi:beta-aspartyl-peptidase (threonine type)
MVVPVIVIHGGAGALPRSELTPEHEAQIRVALQASLHAGGAILSAGGAALDAVEQAVRVMEDSPLFNAGRGAVFTAEGTIELDACIIDGRDRRAGAVAAVRGIRNPVSAARAVMEHTPHVLLASDGALALARRRGLALEPDSYFHTDSRWSALQKAQSRAGQPLSERDRHGTVGAVALDGAGNLAAATSTGGRTNKLAGRVGDTPVVGAGTFADTGLAISGTGDGDVFLRLSAAHRVAMLVALAGRTIMQAAQETLAEIAALGGSGGLIVLDRHGNIACPFNTEGMYRAVLRAGAAPQTGVYRGDP